MSGPLRKALGPCRKALVDEIARKPEVQVDYQQVERNAHLQTLKKYRERLKAKSDRFSKLHDELMHLQLDADDAEEKQIVETWVEENATVIINFDDVMADIDSAIGEIREAQETERVQQRQDDELKIMREQAMAQAHAVGEAQAAAAAAAPAPQQPQAAVAPQKAIGVKLPEFQIPIFEGNYMRWRGFWDVFEATVHKNTGLIPAQKMAYLLNRLRGDAYRCISGLEVCDAEYDGAVQTLKDRFGRPQVAITAHYKALQELPRAPNQLSKLRQTFDSVQTHLNSLSALGQEIEHDTFVALIQSKMPSEVIERIEDSRGDEAWTVESLRKRIGKHLDSRAVAEATSGASPASKQKSDTAPKPDQRSPPTASALMSSTGKPKWNPKKPPPCAFCTKDHYSDHCPTYKTVEARKGRLKGRCWKCLGPKHEAECTRKKPCFYCKNDSHHSSLCPDKFGSRRTEMSHVAGEGEEDHSAATVSTISEGSLLSGGENTILQTAMATVQSNSGSKSGQIRLLFDTGSNRTYVSEKLASLLGLKSKKKQTISVLTFGSRAAKTIETSVVELQLHLLDGSRMTISANVIPTITGDLQRTSIDVSKLKGALYKSLPLADTLPVQSENMNVELLIGNDYFWDLMEDGGSKVTISTGLYLIPSKLGWVLSGRQQSSEKTSQPVTALFVSQMITSETSLASLSPMDKNLSGQLDASRFWDLETIGIKDPMKDVGDEEALARFNESIEFKDGRYHVTWPYNGRQSELPSNFPVALARLNNQLRKYKDQPELFARYKAVFDAQFDADMLEEVDENTVTGPIQHYIPHHAVITPDKATTKLRIVYDASAKVRKGAPSLNDCLHRGPVFLEYTVSLLIRFRLSPIGLIADIEKAFLQVVLKPPDRDVTRFLWIKDTTRLTTENNLIVVRFKRMPFGIVSSPFLLGATIKYHLAQDGSKIAEDIDRNLYVDNLVSGTQTHQSAVEYHQQAKEIFGRASMNIREWASNDADFMKSIPGADRSTTKSPTVLGYTWELQSDTMQMDKPPPRVLNQQVCTKRSVLSFVQSFWDPLGLFSPAFLPAKIFFQGLWKVGVGWDEELSVDLRGAWLEIVSQLTSIKSFSFARYIGLPNVATPQYVLHCFCDASERAYGTCVYLCINSGTNRTCHLIFSKARVAPLAGLSIPRLELLAAFIGSKALEFVNQSLPQRASIKVLWSDSQCVLHWLNSKKPLSTFVRNRVLVIKQGGNTEFRYVSTTENPADLASRGLPAHELATNKLWWHGPKWLTSERGTWPSMDFLGVPDQSEDSPSEHEHVLAAPEGAVVEKTRMVSPLEPIVNKFSSWNSLLRATCMAIRCLKRWQKKKIESEHITADEMQQAKLRWIRHIQSVRYSDAIEAIQKKGSHPVVQALGLWIDEVGVLRCGGRLSNSGLPSSTIHPILLPKDDAITTLIIRNHHALLYHSGVAHTLASIRKEFWIPSGRAQVFKVIRTCVRCKRFDGGPYKVPQMPQLPKCRVTGSQAFTYTGLDYLGPLHAKDAGKVWVCIFTCMATRAVHLELVRDMTAEQFLLAIQRFIARRGTPSAIWSDNAAQFRLVQAAIDGLWTKITCDPTVLKYTAEKGIKWQFIVELAPWRGGFYERLIRLIKQSLRKTLGKLSLRLTHLETVLIEIEAVVNSRPLTYVGADFDSGHALTPSHFLALNTNTGIPHANAGELDDPTFLQDVSSKQRLIETWKKGQRHLESFWKDWHEQYLLSLRERTQRMIKQPHCRSQQEPAIGQVVLLKHDGPRGSWRLGRVTQLINDSDGEIRSAKVLLPTGTIVTRSLAHLHPLECGGEDDDLPRKATLTPDDEPPALITRRSGRAAAKVATDKIRKIFIDGTCRTKETLSFESLSYTLELAHLISPHLTFKHF